MIRAIIKRARFLALSSGLLGRAFWRPLLLFVLAVGSALAVGQITETRVVEVSNGPAGKGGYGSGTPTYDVVAAFDTKLWLVVVLLACLLLIEVARELRYWGSVGD